MTLPLLPAPVEPATSARPATKAVARAIRRWAGGAGLPPWEEPAELSPMAALALALALARVPTRAPVAKPERALAAPLPNGAAAATFPRRVAQTERGNPLSPVARSAAWTALARFVRTRPRPVKAAKPRLVSAVGGSTPFVTASVRPANASTPVRKGPASAMACRRFRSVPGGPSSTTRIVLAFASMASAPALANPMQRAVDRAPPRRPSSAPAKVSGSRPPAAVRPPPASLARALPALPRARAVLRVGRLSSVANSAPGSIKRLAQGRCRPAFKASVARVIQVLAAAVRACHKCAIRPAPLGWTARRARAPRLLAWPPPGRAGRAAPETVSAAARRRRSLAMPMVVGSTSPGALPRPRFASPVRARRVSPASVAAAEQRRSFAATTASG